MLALTLISFPPPIQPALPSPFRWGWNVNYDGPFWRWFNYFRAPAPHPTRSTRPALSGCQDPVPTTDGRAELENPMTNAPSGSYSFWLACFYILVALIVYYGDMAAIVVLRIDFLCIIILSAIFFYHYYRIASVVLILAIRNYRIFLVGNFFRIIIRGNRRL